jgi:hypothetical protein
MHFIKKPAFPIAAFPTVSLTPQIFEFRHQINKTPSKKIGYETD